MADKVDIDAHIGARIRHFRLLADMTQTQLGDLLNAGAGLSCQQVQKYESGDNRISAGTLLEIAAATHAAPHAFYEGIPDFDALIKSKGSGVDPALLSFMSSRSGLSLARDFIRITDQELRRHIATLIRKLADGAGRQTRKDK